MVRNAKFIPSLLHRSLFIMIMLVVVYSLCRCRRGPALAVGRVLLSALFQGAVIVEIFSKEQAENHHKVDVSGALVSQHVPKLV